MESPEKEPTSILPEGYSYHPEGYLWHILPVEKFSELPLEVEVGEQTLSRKTEFHVTVVNARKIARELSGDDPEKTREIETEIQQLLAEYLPNNPITFMKFIDDLRLASFNGRTSIAARCDMENVEGYFELLESTYAKQFQKQPAHVSIYTETGAAVGIDTEEQMESYPKITLPEVQKVLDSVKDDGKTESGE